MEVRELKTRFFTDEGVVRAVDGVSFSLTEGETLGMVGESGCGKSVTALSILRLIPAARPANAGGVPRRGAVAGGEILWEGRDLLSLTEREMRGIRGNDIAMVFQDPFASLNPVFTIGSQVAEAVSLHQGAVRCSALKTAAEALRRVHIPSPETRLDEYPHQISGGMQQRVMIAMGLSCSPKLLIADEPTTALDVTIQAQILDLLREVQADSGMALLLISHDLGVISEMADRIAVMYAGKIVEEGKTDFLLAAPRHPYTRALLRSLPRLGSTKERLEVIKGSVPNPLEYPPGCRFHPRCDMMRELCGREAPGLRELNPGHWSACHFAEEV